MTTFLESPRFPLELSAWAVGGPSYKTSIVMTNSGFEQRNITWSNSLATFNIAEALRMPGGVVNYNVKILRDFFRIARGQAYGFRFQDPLDYSDEGNGYLNGDAGNGYPTSQMYKYYYVGASLEYREIQKPTGTITVFRNSSPVTYGGGAGQISLDSTTGIVYWVADSTASISGITQANPGVVHAVAHGFSSGQLIYLNGVGGMTQVNGIAFTITVTGTDFFSIGVDTTSYTAYAGSGIAYKYPQPTDELMWTGQFDVPCRFGTDIAQIGLGDGGLYSWQSLQINEIRI